MTEAIEIVRRHVTPGCECHTCRTLLMICDELRPAPPEPDGDGDDPVFIAR